jgi:hypothetical protein
MSVDGGKADLALERIGAVVFAPLVAPSAMKRMAYEILP